VRETTIELQKDGSERIQSMTEEERERERERERKREKDRKRERRNPTMEARRVRERREEDGERGWHESG